ncbi:putative AraC family transcriptional regulator [Lunatimonas lonarensis]|uniref:Putative AraC family transcriptional regulator n=2 Tax=Lunatimonas lonarensis TaxID=1232681 RepID=R7ZLF4_9BACT|nr:putative AraC family transcriptional regulator [Lunatimonas lonarensis]
MYLVPSFTTCSYFFHPGLQMIYVHFGLSMKDGIDAFNLMGFYQTVKANDLMKYLFTRLRDINPNREIPHHDPMVYQRKPWTNQRFCFDSLKQHLETTSLLGQILSNFIQPEIPLSAGKILRYGLQPILYFIQTNLDKEITVEQLASMACFSPDHFTRTFKSALGVCPNEYIISKRIEKAKALLLTTKLSQSQIMEESGIRNTSYFTRVFKKHTNLTPSAYRRLHME